MSVVRRRDSRICVMQGLYALELSQDNPLHIIETIFTPLKTDDKNFHFAKQLFIKTIEHQNEIDELLKKKLEHWEFHRVALLDKILLRIGICEFLFFDDIPPKVSINELIEIAKEFSTDNSGQFVNGMLDAILLSLKKEGKIQKQGRGLLDTAIKPTSPEE